MALLLNTWVFAKILGWTAFVLFAHFSFGVAPEVASGILEFLFAERESGKSFCIVHLTKYALHLRSS